ncbi:hypothetical protein SAMN05444008_106137 [Cnuella takakiae]|uniref:Uncharacterized protein n=1 Tax=Cnuella takakiae TaxID=1302690 RepID=A0A1M5A6Z3_9BACT|nr:hypothetical protein [Cnuella takakiae]OLY92075.1 hypothetical protein BUE76_09340 [Cnuella takakiae]SHF25907.1 hypothetical protein SAMN05444008_106137 [Cnuella takakiae]
MSSVTETNKVAGTQSFANLDLSDVQAPNTSAILETLRAQAAQTLAAALGAQPLVSFAIGAGGNFPYYYKDPANLNFNTLTYNWINTNLHGGTAPVQQSTGSFFSNLFISVLSKVTYKLSTADQVKLNAATSAAQDQQMALLTLWKSTYGSFPSGNGSPTDNILNTIVTTWATNPGMTLYKLRNSTDLSNDLQNAPATGLAIMPVVANYLYALGDSVSLQDQVTMNNAYLNNAKRAVQTPTADNGGLLGNDSKYYPAYTVTTPLNDIINGLKASGNDAKISMQVSNSSENQFSVSVGGSTSFKIPILDFLTIGINGNANYFHEEIANSSNSVSIDMTFSGLTLVNYAPAAYNMSTGQNWFYMQPIMEAIANKGQDVSGFQFSPDPGVDFGPNGPFGILQGVAISNYPSMVITVTGSNYQSIANTFQQSSDVMISFLGIPLGRVSESTYSHNAQTSGSNSSVTITLNPPPELVAGTNTTSMGWVLGVQTNYPAVS